MASEFGPGMSRRIQQYQLGRRMGALGGAIRGTAGAGLAAPRRTQLGGILAGMQGMFGIARGAGRNPALRQARQAAHQQRGVERQKLREVRTQQRTLNRVFGAMRGLTGR